MNASRELWQAVEAVRVSCEHGPDAGGAVDRAINGYESWCESHGVQPDYDANIEAMGRRAAAESLLGSVPWGVALDASRRAMDEYPYTGIDRGIAIDAAEYAMEER